MCKCNVHEKVMWQQCKISPSSALPQWGSFHVSTDPLPFLSKQSLRPSGVSMWPSSFTTLGSGQQQHFFVAIALRPESSCIYAGCYRDTLEPVQSFHRSSFDFGFFPGSVAPVFQPSEKSHLSLATFLKDTNMAAASLKSVTGPS